MAKSYSFRKHVLTYMDSAIFKLVILSKIIAKPVIIVLDLEEEVLLCDVHARTLFFMHSDPGWVSDQVSWRGHPCSVDIFIVAFRALVLRTMEFRNRFEYDEKLKQRRHVGFV